MTSSMAIAASVPGEASSSAARSMALPVGWPEPTARRPVAMAMGAPGSTARRASAQRAARAASSVARPPSTMVTTRVPPSSTSSCPPWCATTARSSASGTGSGTKAPVTSVGSSGPVPGDAGALAPMSRTAATRCSLAVSPARIWLDGAGSAS